MNSKAAEKYLASGGDHCPYCGSADIDYRYIGGSCTGPKEVKCNGVGCFKNWTDHYRLVGVDEFQIEKKGDTQ